MVLSAQKSLLSRKCPKSGMGFAVLGLVLGGGMSALMALGGLSAQAGEYTPPKGEEKAKYVFTGCQEPAIPVIGLDQKKKGNASIRDYNAQVALYNGFIAKMQTYMTCLSQEADQDLQTYYDAVSDSLETRQGAMMVHSNELRAKLASGPIKDRSKPRPKNIPALAGGRDDINAGTDQNQRLKGTILPPIENKPLIKSDRKGQ